MGLQVHRILWLHDSFRHHATTPENKTRVTNARWANERWFSIRYEDSSASANSKCPACWHCRETPDSKGRGGRGAQALKAFSGVCFCGQTTSARYHVEPKTTEGLQRAWRRVDEGHEIRGSLLLKTRTAAIGPAKFRGSFFNNMAANSWNKKSSGMS